MSENGEQDAKSEVFCYSIEAPVGSFEFRYDAGGVVLNDILELAELSPFSNGSKLRLFYDVPVGIMGSSWDFALVFRSPVSFGEPLPVGRFSPADSSVVYTPGGDPPLPSTTSPVHGVTRKDC